MATQTQVSSEKASTRLKCHLYPVLTPLAPEVVFKLCASYHGRKLELDMTEPSLDVYTLVAIKSKVA